MTKLENRKKLNGVIPAIIVPFDEDGLINMQLLRKQADYLASSGVQGFLLTALQEKELGYQQKKR